jgi:dephospho-CoA kinase
MNIGVTGNIASGKTTAAQMLKDMIGAAIVDADTLGHYLLASHADIQRMVTLEFGAEILNPDNSIDRRKLSRLVFSDPGHLNRLNRIFYPVLIYEVKMEVLKAARIFRHVILDAALIVEWDIKRDLDALILVTAPEAERLRRLTRLRRLLEEDAANMMASQAPEEYKTDQADYIVKNDGALPSLKDQIADVARKLKLL